MNRNRLIQDLDFLSGPIVAGRLSGTPGAHQAARYLAAGLQELGLLPAGDRDYFQSVSVPAARFVGQPRLVVDGQSYQHRRDYAEFTALSSSGYCAGQLMIARENDLLDPHPLSGNIVLIPERPKGFDLGATANAAADLGVAALLVESGEPDWFHKTVYAGHGRLPVLRVRKSLAQKYSQSHKAHLELDLPLSMETRTCQNVLGLLRGESETFTLALTAHYDHLGDDPNGVRFPGALDNASGVAAVLAVARRLAAHAGRLPFNVLIALLTGEESGLWGAKHVVAHPPRPLSAVINIDSIGSEANLAAMRLGHRQRGDWLAELAEGVLEARGISAQWIGGSDDSSVFISNGIPTVGLGQQSTGSQRSVMHTPADHREALHVEAVEETVSVMMDLVNTLADRRAGDTQIQERNVSHV